MADKETPDSKVRKTLYKERVATGTHNYFIDLKLTSTGSKYLVIDQRRKVGDRYESAKLRVFEDELLEFQRILGRMIHIALNYYEPLSLFSTSDAPTPIKKTETEYQHDFNSELYPSFFGKLLSTNNWEEFERYTYYLLKLLGIQTAYKFLGERQAGKADGFFKFGNLAVMYDCTLDNRNIESDKKDQIINYCNRLKLGSIELSGNAIEEFHNYHKQVWIITRGKTRSIKLINDINVKEIAVEDIIGVYQERLEYPATNEQIEFKLRNL
ncbi:MAG: hypothetical protein ACXADW_23400 [Candidatus Hodarchaeales archaeon]|jgi:hypothetical protein